MHQKMNYKGLLSRARLHALPFLFLCVLVALSVLEQNRREEKPNPVAQKTLSNFNGGDADHMTLEMMATSLSACCVSKRV